MTYAFKILISFYEKMSLNLEVFVTVVALCDRLILDINDFFGYNIFRKIGFSLKNKVYALFFAVFVFIYKPIASSLLPENIYSFLVQLLKI